MGLYSPFFIVILDGIVPPKVLFLKKVGKHGVQVAPAAPLTHLAGLPRKISSSYQLPVGYWSVNPWDPPIFL